MVGTKRRDEVQSAEHAGIEAAHRAMQALAPLIDQMNALDDEEVRLAELLDQFAVVVRRGPIRLIS